MLHRLGRQLASVVVLVFCLLAVARAQDPVLHFGILSTEACESLRIIWQPLLDDMGQQIGQPVQPVFADGYGELIDGLRQGRIDIAWLGNKAALAAVDGAGAEIFAQTSMDNGLPGYYGLLIVRDDSPIHTVSDLLRLAPQLTFGNGDFNSTSGYLVTGYYLFARRHVDPATAFKRTLNQSHEANALGVASGELDAATFNTDNWDRLALVNPQALARLRVIWKSQMIPSDPILWRTSLPAPLKAKVRSFLLGYGKTEREVQVLKGLQQNRFVASNDDQLLPIRQLLLFKERTDVAASQLSVEQKTARFREIDAQLGRLQDRIKPLEGPR